MRALRIACGIGIAALVLAGSLLPTSVVAGELKPFTATYAINWRGMSGTAQIQLEKLPEGRWSYRRETSAPALFPRFLLPAEMSPRRSIFRIQNDQLIPESFTVGAGSSSESKDQNIMFDWVAGRVRGVVERRKVDLPIQPGLLDELSVQAALMHALLAGRTPEGFVMLDEDRIKDYLYAAEGKERLKTSIGEYDTVIFRSNRPGNSKGTWFWCAPELGYLPLKVERRDGRNVEWSMRLQQVMR